MPPYRRRPSVPLCNVTTAPSRNCACTHCLHSLYTMLVAVFCDQVIELTPASQYARERTLIPASQKVNEDMYTSAHNSKSGNNVVESPSWYSRSFATATTLLCLNTCDPASLTVSRPPCTKLATLVGSCFAGTKGRTAAALPAY